MLCSVFSISLLNMHTISITQFVTGSNTFVTGIPVVYRVRNTYPSNDLYYLQFGPGVDPWLHEVIFEHCIASRNI